MGWKHITFRVGLMLLSSGRLVLHSSVAYGQRGANLQCVIEYSFSSVSGMAISSSHFAPTTGTALTSISV